MILSQPEIREAVGKGEIRFEPPLQERQWHEASVDLRLGFNADAGLWKEKVLKREDELGKQETFTIDPGEFILAQTYERVWIPCHPHCSGRGSQLICPRRPFNASNGTLASARLEWSNYPRNLQ